MSALRLLEAAEAEITQELFSELLGVRRYLNGFSLDEIPEDSGIDVRLNVQVAEDCESYSWSLDTGDSSYDQDHRGFWGSSTVVWDDDEVTLVRAARDLVEQVLEHCAVCERYGWTGS